MANLRRGSRGAAVRQAQLLLNQNGANPPLATDGIFGANSDRAVRDFQRKSRLSVDGVIGPNTQTALAGASGTPPRTPTPRTPPPRGATGGQQVTLAHATKYKGQVLGPSPYQGECAAGVQVVFGAASKSLGLTRTWKPGVQVRGNNVSPGTAIASFNNGRYWKHAAILIRETASGLEVWDQWAGQPWHVRTLRFNDNDTHDGSNNGNLFFVISK